MRWAACPERDTTQRVFDGWCNRTCSAQRDGSIWSHGDNRNVPYLNLNGNERELNLNWWSNNWNGNYQFLAVRSSLWKQPFAFIAEGCFVIVYASHQASFQFQ